MIAFTEQTEPFHKMYLFLSKSRYYRQCCVLQIEWNCFLSSAFSDATITFSYPTTDNFIVRNRKSQTKQFFNQPLCPNHIIKAYSDTKGIAVLDLAAFTLHWLILSWRNCDLIINFNNKKQGHNLVEQSTGWATRKDSAFWIRQIGSLGLAKLKFRCISER